jgi:hypothetical protein
MEELRADQVEEFYSSFWGVKPCIVRGATRHSNAAFVAATRRGPLLRAHGNATLVLSTANTASYEKRSLGLREYVEQLMGPQDEGRSGEETWYQFGDQPAALNPLMAVYELPVAWMRHVNSSALSFGLSGTGTGVPFHTHGEWGCFLVRRANVMPKSFTKTDPKNNIPFTEGASMTIK